MSSALVTGGTGFIGSRLVTMLLERGWAVRSCGRRPRPEGLPPQVDYRVVDLAGTDDLSPLFHGITHLFHLAGASSSLSSEAQMHEDNVRATERLLAAAPAGQLERVVYMSSTSVYGETVQLPSPVTEDVPPRPSRGYGKAKWAAERVVWQHGDAGLPVTVLRPVSVHGPGSVKLLAGVILDVAIERYAGASCVPVLAPVIEQRLVHIDDLIGACLHLVRREDAVGRAFNVVSGVYPSSHQVARLVAAEFDLDVTVVDEADPGPSYPQRQATRERMLAAGMAPDILLSKERFRFLRKANRNNRLSIDALLGTGFVPAHADVEAAVRDDVAWYRAHRWIL